MEVLKNLEENSILIIPNNIRKKVLSYMDQNNILKSTKIMTFRDLKVGLLFDFNNETINYVMENYKVNYGVSKDYLNSLYYLEKKDYNQEKFIFLSNLMNDLNNKNLLIKDKLFINLIKSKNKVYIYGFTYINKFNNHLLNMIKNFVDIIILDKDTFDSEINIYEFKTMEDEIAYVFESISSLIKNGTPLNKIYIANYKDEYYFTFRRLMNLYGLPIYIKSNDNLYSTVIGKFIIDNLNNNKDALVYKLKKIFNYEENVNNANVINKFINLINTYYWCDNLLEVKDLIIEEMKNTFIQGLHYEEEILCTNIIDNVFLDDEYVFLIGFNLGSVPKIKRDEDYINDDIKPDFIEKTNEYNSNIKDAYIKAISSIKNITISYKLKDAFNTYSPSFLAKGEIFKTIKMDSFISSFSNKYNEISLAKGIDNLIKFNEIDSNLEVLYNNYKIDYKSYDNSFDGINDKTLKELLDNNFIFSYSNINDYYLCPFKFYLNHILKINTSEDTLEKFIGNLFHYVLENHLKNNIDIDELYKEYINNNLDSIGKSNKVDYFLETLNPEIKFIIDTIKEQYKHSSHNEAFYEKDIIVDIKRNINTKIKGRVDKLLKLDNYYLIIDYKTGSSDKIDKSLFEFGIGIQLPIYLYLLKCINPESEVAGIYIQHILDLNQDYDFKKDYNEERKKKLKLAGITINDINLISKFDDSYDSSVVIDSLKTKDGEIKKSKKIMDKDERDELTNLLEKLVMNVIDKVTEANFKISPIKIDKKVDGCEYCSYKDICYKKFKDFNIQYIKDEEVFEDE